MMNTIFLLIAFFIGFRIVGALIRSKKNAPLSHEEQREMYAEKTKKTPSDHTVWTEWGHTLFDMAAASRDETQQHAYIDEAIEKFSQAQKLAPTDADVYKEWVERLLELTEFTTSLKRKFLFNKALEIVNQSIRLFPNQYTMVLNKIRILYKSALSTTDDETRNTILEEAVTICQTGIAQNKGSYKRQHSTLSLLLMVIPHLPPDRQSELIDYCLDTLDKMAKKNTSADQRQLTEEALELKQLLTEHGSSKAKTATYDYSVAQPESSAASIDQWFGANSSSQQTSHHQQTKVRSTPSYTVTQEMKPTTTARQTTSQSTQQSTQTKPSPASAQPDDIVIDLDVEYPKPTPEASSYASSTTSPSPLPSGTLAPQKPMESRPLSHHSIGTSPTTQSPLPSQTLAQPQPVKSAASENKSRLQRQPVGYQPINYKTADKS